MTERQWKPKYQILIIFVLEILISQAAPVERTTTKLDGKHAAARKALPKKSTPLKTGRTSFLAEESIPQQFFSSPYMRNLIPSHDNNNNVGSGWYGFQHFVPRQSRILNDRNNREESLYILGEKRQTTSSTSPFASQENAHGIPQQQQQNFQYIHYDDAVLQEDQEIANENALPVINTQILRSSVPVTLSIIPLKMTSHEIAQALQKMHWVPVPMHLSPQFSNERREQQVQAVFEVPHHEVDDETKDEVPMYHDRSLTEQSYPPPSSHVATPLENPPAISYDRGMSFESYETGFHPRTFSKS